MTAVYSTGKTIRSGTLTIEWDTDREYEILQAGFRRAVELLALAEKEGDIDAATIRLPMQAFLKRLT